MVCGRRYPAEERLFFRLLVSITDESSSLCFRQFYAWCVEGKILLQAVSGAPRPLFLCFSVAIAFPYPLSCIVGEILRHTIRFAFWASSGFGLLFCTAALQAPKQALSS